jgi:2-polyprenyl-6-methoxyphenol hydroxylase-like FAD-dependent oxidoreductase
MNILISGAGIACLTLAYWLKQYGFTPTIIERAPHLPTGGYKIDIRGTAIEILNRMGIYQKIVASSTNMQEAILIDKNGKVLHKMSGDAFGHRTGDDFEIIRGELCKILMAEISEIEYIFDEDIKTITQTNKKVKIEFKKNTPREFDLLIGADGLHSNVRELVFGDSRIPSFLFLQK